MDALGWERRRAALVLGGLIAVLGLPAARSLAILGLMDQVAGNVFLLAGGLGLSVFVGWVMADPIGEVSQGADGVRWFGLWRVGRGFA
jgi:SNF family Na+-dependent transporter